MFNNYEDAKKLILEELSPPLTIEQIYAHMVQEVQNHIAQATLVYHEEIIKLRAEIQTLNDKITSLEKENKDLREISELSDKSSGKFFGR